MKIIAEESKNIHKSLGSKDRTVSDDEIEKRKHFRRSLVVNKDLKEGYILKKEDTFLLPRRGGGLGIGTVTAVLGVITSSILIANQLR